jgi:hypothetical protein
MRAFDAQLMWDALDQQAIQAMTSQGGSEQALQQNSDGAKKSGGEYLDVVFVATYPLQDGGQYVFYVVTRRGFAGAGVTDQTFFVFTVGANGKIVKMQ